MTEILVSQIITLAALVAAGGWIVYQQRLVSKQLRALQEMAARVGFLESVLLDIARGEADVWIEDNEVRAQRKTTGKVQIH